MSYTLSVHIPSQDIQFLRENRYRLCIARRVSGKYTVVFQGDAKLMNNNHFEFRDEFQIFALDEYPNGILKQTDTDPIEIKLGQATTLTKDRILTQASGSAELGKPLRIMNRAGPVYFGLNASLGGHFFPVYVSDTKFMSGDVYITPVRKFLIWFGTNLETGSVLTEAVSNSIVVDFTKTKDIKMKYISHEPGHGHWIKDGSASYSHDYDPGTSELKLHHHALPTVSRLEHLEGHLNNDLNDEDY